MEEITNLYNFGLQLDIDSKVLDRIERDYRNDVERQRSEIIKFWYRNTEESERTWGRVADAIKRLGGHRNLETKLRQLGTTRTGPGTNLRIATTPRAASSPTAFSDALSPTELVSWLSQQFQAKGLTLDPSLGQKLTGILSSYQLVLCPLDSMCSYMYVYAYIIHAHTCASVCMSLCKCVHVSVHAHVYACVCTCGSSGESYTMEPLYFGRTPLGQF